MMEAVNALLVDAGCFERGCACYDPRDQVPPVPMVKQKVWVNLTDEECDEIWMNLPYEVGSEEIRAIEKLIKEKNL